TVPSLRFAAFVFAVVVTLLFIFFLYRTKTGIAIRGVAQSKPVAGLMGINSQRIAAIVYAIYTGLTATSGVLIGAIFSVNPEMGVRYTIFAFFVVVAAGMGYLPGVVVAGLLLGILDAFVAVYIGGAYTHLVVFLFLYVLLLVAPKGILGRGI
ncbi:MAG: branched-chain amino acid ABC transporter permease, partial [Actinobacteria bacterium]|nr:branched-chain amino acid ABC transporter permease [Actinomycetota bacterium]